MFTPGSLMSFKLFNHPVYYQDLSVIIWLLPNCDLTTSHLSCVYLRR